MPTDDFETRLQEAEESLQSEIDQTETELKELRRKRGRLKGQGAPEARILGTSRRISALEDRLENLEETDPVDLVEEESPTSRRYHSL